MLFSFATCICSLSFFFFFFFNDTATTEIYTLSLHDALPISHGMSSSRSTRCPWSGSCWVPGSGPAVCDARHSSCTTAPIRSEEHTSELQSLAYLVCRLLLEKKKRKRV